MTVKELEMHKGNALFCLRQCQQYDTLRVVERLFIDAIGKAELKGQDEVLEKGEEDKCQDDLTDC